MGNAQSWHHGHRSTASDSDMERMSDEEEGEGEEEEEEEELASVDVFCNSDNVRGEEGGGRRRWWCGATMKMTRKTSNLRSGAIQGGTDAMFAKHGSRRKRRS